MAKPPKAQVTQWELDVINRKTTSVRMCVSDKQQRSQLTTDTRYAMNK
jgi:hypothetical protein